MNSERITLVSNASATGSDFTFRGGRAMFMAEATWGGGTVKLQVKSPNGTYIDVNGGSLTANGTSAALYLPQGLYRANIATASAVYAYLIASE